jgi:hypothetical protein
VDLLVPVIDLHATHVWMPRPDRPFAQIYMRAHRLAGWFLIPMGVEAVTGLIHQRRRERAITPGVLNRIGSVLLDVFVGYGRRSTRTRRCGGGQCHAVDMPK